MAEGNSSTPDLQTVLATLAQFAPQAVNATHSSSSSSPVVQPALKGTPTPTVPSQAWPEQQQPTTGDPRLRKPNGPNPAPTQRVIDPATITTWEDGLRCVTKIAALNEHFASEIRKMIMSQSQAERRWWSERQELLRTQARRKVASAKARSIVSSLGSTGTSEPTSEESLAVDTHELHDFDMEVWAGQQAVSTAQSTHLKNLGVPYFGTDPSLVVDDVADLADLSLSEDRPKWSPIITGSQLRSLRDRMTNHLETLYKD